MKYNGRELLRLWELEIVNGFPDRPEQVSFTVETVLAFNAVEATRVVGNKRLNSQPEPVCYVTWPDEENNDDTRYRIDSPRGPSTEVIVPSILPAGEEEW